MQRTENAERADVISASDRKVTRMKKARYRKVQTETVRHAGRPFARVRSGIRTGTTPHFQMWMADLRASSALQRLKLDRLADEIHIGELAAAFAILRVNGRIKNVHALAKSDAGTLLSIPQIGPKRLGVVERYLNSKDVYPGWGLA